MCLSRFRRQITRQVTSEEPAVFSVVVNVASLDSARDSNPNKGVTRGDQVR